MIIEYICTHSNPGYMQRDVVYNFMHNTKEGFFCISSSYIKLLTVLVLFELSKESAAHGFNSSDSVIVPPKMPNLLICISKAMFEAINFL